MITVNLPSKFFLELSSLKRTFFLLSTDSFLSLRKITPLWTGFSLNTSSPKSLSRVIKIRSSAFASLKTPLSVNPILLATTSRPALWRNCGTAGVLLLALVAFFGFFLGVFLPLPY